MYIEKRSIINIMMISSFLVFIVMGQIGGIDNTESSFRYYAWLTIVSFVLFIISNNSGIFSATWFVILFLYIYNCGQVWLELFRIELDYSSFTITRYSYYNISKAICFFLMVINIFEICAIYFNKTVNGVAKNEYLNEFEAEQNNIALRTTLKIMSFVCIITVLYNDIMSILLAQTAGYLETYRTGRDNSFIIMMIEMYPLLIVSWILIGKPLEKKIFGMYAVIRSILMMFLVGNRGQYIAMLVVLFLIYNIEIKNNTNAKISLKKGVGILILGAGILSIASYVAASRNVIGVGEQGFFHFYSMKISLFLL